MRHKEVHGINVPAGLKYVIDFGMSLVSEKIRKRIKVSLFRQYIGFISANVDIRINANQNTPYFCRSITIYKNYTKIWINLFYQRNTEEICQWLR